MAKSLRSKWKRKMRAIKRERYGAKELTKLKEIVASSKEIRKKVAVPVLHVEMTDVSRTEGEEDRVEEMQVDKTVRKYKKNLQDQFGNYPVWLNPRRVKKQQKRKKKIGKIVKRNAVNKSKR
uniref:Protein LLP homolog n=1 Tax=Strigamia maritima TaxID=126957 RepID=T1JFQ6_STRMM